MADANDESVLGRFDGSTFSYAGKTSTFSKRDGAFYLRTDGRDGRLADFRVKYTFGSYPLQQSQPRATEREIEVCAQCHDADRVEARVNLGTFYGSRGDVVKAKQELNAAIRLEPSFAPANVRAALASFKQSRGPTTPARIPVR